MTRRPDTHLSVDDIDAWLAGHLGTTEQEHLDSCAECREAAQADRVLTAQLAGLTIFSPSPLFADRVMASVAVPDPFALRSMQTARRRLFATRHSLAVAAMLAVIVVGSMAVSVVWSLSHRETIAAAGSWLAASAGQWLWTGLRSVVSGVIEQPWYGGLRGLVGSPARLAAMSALASLTYAGGVLALRKLMTAPSGPVSHANA
ncbi:MAG: hypothetical protein ACM3OH_04900 [Bacillota bacterium]|jgi:hypothetical protein